jgi:branched-chain amino acid transport system substrate-binding protein
MIGSKSRNLAAAGLVAVGLGPCAALAKDVLIADVTELSGGGASNGANWKEGLELAADEINTKGGILGHPIKLIHLDTQTNPGTSRAMVQKALDQEPFAIMGPIYSGSVKVNMALAQEAAVPQFVGAQAAELTEMGNGFLFRANISQRTGIEKIATYLEKDMKAKRVAIVWVNNDFGKGGRDLLTKALRVRGMEVVVDIPIEYGQLNYSVEVGKIRSSSADAVFPYMTAEDTSRFILEYRKSALTLPLVGETTLLQQNVLDVAGSAANGVICHLSLSANAPGDLMKAFRNKFEQRFKHAPDHNAISSYTAMYAVKHAAEKAGKLDGNSVAAALHGLTITTTDEPGILLESSWDAKGDLRRPSFIGEAVDGKVNVIGRLD